MRRFRRLFMLSMFAVVGIIAHGQQSDPLAQDYLARRILLGTEDPIHRLRVKVGDLVTGKEHTITDSDQNARRLVSASTDLIKDYPTQTRQALRELFQIRFEGDSIITNTAREDYEQLAKELRIPVEEVAGLEPGKWGTIGPALDAKALRIRQAREAEETSEAMQNGFVGILVISSLGLILFFLVKLLRRNFEFAKEEGRLWLNPVQRTIAALAGIGLGLYTLIKVNKYEESSASVIPAALATGLLILALHGLRRVGRRVPALGNGAEAPGSIPDPQVVALETSITQALTTTGICVPDTNAEPLIAIPTEPQASVDPGEPEKIAVFTSALNSAGFVLILWGILTIIGSGGQRSGAGAPGTFDFAIGLFLFFPSTRKGWVGIAYWRALLGALLMPLLAITPLFAMGGLELFGYELAAIGLLSFLYKMRTEHDTMPYWRLWAGWALFIVGIAIKFSTILNR